MPRNENAARSLPATAATETIKAADYSEGMFADGHNRTARNDNTAAAYDEAAHTVSPEDDSADIASDNVAQPAEILQSRDGTEASGTLDEDGGSLGGTEEELDSLEAGGTPVDKNPRMKD